MTKKYFGNIAVLSFGTLLAQLITVLGSLVLTRLYSPDKFGELSIYLSIVMILTPIYTLRYDLSLLLPKREVNSINLFFFSLLLACFFFILNCFLIAFILFFISVEIDFWILLIPVGVLINSILSSTQQLANRFKVYNRISVGKVIQVSTSTIINIFFSFIRNGFNFLLIGQVFGYLINLLLLFFKIYEKFGSNKIKKNRIVFLSKKYSNFPKYNVLSSILNIASSQAPVFLLAILFSNSIVGFYSLSNRVLVLPLTIIGTSISQVYFQKIANNQDHHITNLTYKTLKNLFLISIIPFSLLTIFGDVFFLFFFGNDWVIAGYLTQILAPWLFVVFIVSPVTTLLIAREKQKFLMYFNIIFFSLRCFGIFIGWFFYDDYIISLYFFSFISLLFWLYQCWYILNLSAIPRNKMILPILFFILLLFILKYLRDLFQL